MGNQEARFWGLRAAAGKLLQETDLPGGPSGSARGLTRKCGQYYGEAFPSPPADWGKERVE